MTWTQSSVKTMLHEMFENVRIYISVLKRGKNLGILVVVNLLYRTGQAENNKVNTFKWPQGFTGDG